MFLCLIWLFVFDMFFCVWYDINFLCLIWLFVKIFPNFYNKIKHKAGNRFHPPIENNKPMENFQIKQIYRAVQFVGSQNFLVVYMLGIREHRSGWFVRDSFILRTMYTFKISMKVLLGYALKDFCLDTVVFFFWFSIAFCSEFLFNFSEGIETFL